MLYVLLRKLSADFGALYKWESVSDYSWYFEMQDESSWIEYKRDKILYNYTQVAWECDDMGFPIVTLRRSDQNSCEICFCQLKQGKLYKSTSSKFNESDQYERGIWVRKNPGRCKNAKIDLI